VASGATIAAGGDIRGRDSIIREDIESFRCLLELNPFAVQFRYEPAGEDFPNFEHLAHTAKQLLNHVRSLHTGG
jgi:hypothetical protein